jgi:hypothetical protein
MKVVVEHVPNGEETITAVPGIVTVRVVDDRGKPMTAVDNGRPVPEDGVQVALGQRGHFEISDGEGDDPDLDGVWIEAAAS